MIYSNIMRVLAEKASNHIHAFRSGGGLRILRLERDKELVGYGEAPNFDTALEYLEEDVAAGGHNYEDVYGENKLHPHYLTGTTKTSSNIDRWLLSGNSFDIRNLHRHDNDYEFKSTFLDHLDFKQYHENALKNKYIVVELDGITYAFFKVNDKTGGTTGKVIENKSGLDPWMREYTIRYEDISFGVLLAEVNRKLTYWLDR
jgi:hypothetical protein